MAVSRLLLAMVASLCIVAMNHESSRAQIFNAPLPKKGVEVQQASGNIEAAQSSGGIQTTSWMGLPMPKLTMPRVTMPTISMPKWPSSQSGGASASSPWAPLTSGWSKISSGTRKAWDGTKEMLTIGSDEKNTMQPMAQVTPPAEPSFWRRLIGKAPEPDGPQTVAEWMSQPRLDP